MLATKALFGLWGLYTEIICPDTTTCLS